MAKSGESVEDLEALSAVIVKGQTDHPAQRKYLEVADGILAAIGTGSLAPGDRLPNERLLAEICRTSRNSVRDALLVLEVSGVLEVRPGSGCYVTDLRPARRRNSSALMDSVPHELLEARLAIEPAVARSAARRREPTAIEQLRTLIDDCEAEGLREGVDDLGPWLRLSHEFHARLASNCGNSIFADLTLQLVDLAAHPLWQLVNAMHVREPTARAEQIAEHREILDAVERGDEDAAAEAMVYHLGDLEANIFGAKRVEPTIRRQRPRSRRNG